MVLVYAQVAELRADPAVPDGSPPTNAELEALLVTAEETVDRLIGPRDVDADTGRKYVVDDAGPLTAAQRAALKRATILVALELYADPNAFDPPAGSRIKGPDFEVDEPATGTARARLALLRAAGVLDAVRLRVLTASPTTR